MPSYQQRNAASVAATGKTLYERRVERGISAGLSRDQARGHPNYKRSEPLVTQLPKEKRPPRQRPAAPRTPRPPRTPKPASTLAKMHRRGKTSKIEVYDTKGRPTGRTKATAVWGEAGPRRLINILQDIERVERPATIKVHHKDGTVSEIFGNGQRPGRILTSITESGLSVRDWIIAQLTLIYGEDEDLADDDFTYELELIA